MSHSDSHKPPTSQGILIHTSKTSIRSVPGEVLTEIFHAFALLGMKEQGIFKRGIIHRGPIFLGSICKGWRAVTLSCPRLWTSVSGRIHSPAALLKAGSLLRLINSRSGACPLQITLRIQLDFELLHSRDREAESCDGWEDLINALAASAERWQVLSITCGKTFMHGLRHALAKRLPWSLSTLENLEILSSDGHWPVPLEYMYKYSEGEQKEQDHLPRLLSIFAVAPKLHRVTIDAYDLCDEERVERLRIVLPWLQLKQLEKFHLTAHDFMWLLTQCPNLIRCNRFIIKNIDQSMLATNSTPFPLQSLGIHFLDRAEHNDIRIVMARFFQNFHFPSLRELRVEISRDWTSPLHSRFIVFLANISSLYRLVFRLHDSTMRLDDLVSILHAVSSLVEIEICQDLPLEYEDIGEPMSDQDYLINRAINPYEMLMPRQRLILNRDIMLNQELLEAFMSQRPGSATPILPKMRVLSLVGQMRFDCDDLVSMLQTRDSEGSIALERMHLWVVGSLGANCDTDPITDLLGDRAHIDFAYDVPDDSPTFHDLL
ncbi:hypothetical protein HWV62_27071 [Athelia sp. TMB]|nr:hypothetical protein HWV62_27071 [Athelia sp. TMB]